MGQENGNVVQFPGNGQDDHTPEQKARDKEALRQQVDNCPVVRGGPLFSGLADTAMARLELDIAQDDIE